MLMIVLGIVAKLNDTIVVGSYDCFRICSKVEWHHDTSARNVVSMIANSRQHIFSLLFECYKIMLMES